MSRMMRHAKGYVYSIGGGLLRYDGPKYTYGDKASEVFVVHIFTVVKRLNSITRDVKAWDKYRVTHWELDRNRDCITFKRGIFKLLKYEPTLTVLHGNPS